MDESLEPVSFLHRRLAASFERTVVVIAPDSERRYDASEWGFALVVVERGRIELKATDGSHHPFGPGDILYLDGLPLRALCNSGPEPAVLVAIRRRAC